MSNTRLRHSGMLALAMLLAAAAALFARPTVRLADTRPKLILEELVPTQFGVWTTDQSALPLTTISPEQAATLRLIYNQTLSRTYLSTTGKRVMLSIAYGGEQTDTMQVHRPEVCYPAQGFTVVTQANTILNTGFGEIPVKRLVAVQGSRVEAITYWITVGDTVAINKLFWKLAQLKISLTGKIPDGLIFRVSSLGGDEQSAYALQDQFVRELLEAMNPARRKRLIGGVG